MSYTPLKATLGICVSLASHLAFADTAPVSLAADVPTHSYASVVDTLSAPPAQPAQASIPDRTTSNENQLQTSTSSNQHVTLTQHPEIKTSAPMSGLQDLSTPSPVASVATSIQTTPVVANPIQTTEVTTVIPNGDPATATTTTATTTDASSDSTASAPAADATTATTDGSTPPNSTLNRIGQSLGYSIDKIGEIGGKIGGSIGELGAKIAVNATAAQPDPVKDPFEHFNRAMWNFNFKLDKYILLPVANAYVHVVPQIVRTGVGNFFSNLGQPWTAVNNLLQGHPGTSIASLSRFVINTVTTLGFYDTAGYLGIPKSNEDFGQTLGVWGVGSGPFLMLPILGPSTVRDSLAQIVDQFGYPPNYLDNTWETFGLTAIRVVNSRANLIGLEHFVEGDQYSLSRDVYLQNREFQIHGAGNSSTPTADGFGDDGFGDDAAKGGVSTAPAAPTSSDPAATAQPATF